jgi:hypothetical protein
MENLDDAGLSATAVTFSLGEKFIEVWLETQFLSNRRIGPAGVRQGRGSQYPSDKKPEDKVLRFQG